MQGACYSFQTAQVQCVYSIIKFFFFATLGLTWFYCDLLRIFHDGIGQPCIDALDIASKEYPEIADTTRFGSSGHSQGGGASITCAYLLEQKYGDQAKVAVHAVQPAHGMSRAGVR